MLLVVLGASARVIYSRIANITTGLDAEQFVLEVYPGNVHWRP